MSTYYEPGAKQDGGESSHMPPYTQPMLGASPPPGTSLFPVSRSAAAGATDSSGKTRGRLLITAAGSHCHQPTTFYPPSQNSRTRSPGEDLTGWGMGLWSPVS